jgi:hypothetical protein
MSTIMVDLKKKINSADRSEVMLVCLLACNENL